MHGVASISVGFIHVVLPLTTQVKIKGDVPRTRTLSTSQDETWEHVAMIDQRRSKDHLGKLRIQSRKRTPGIRKYPQRQLLNCNSVVKHVHVHLRKVRIFDMP